MNLYEPFQELVKAIQKETEIQTQLFSLILFGSYIRGDFIENQSDLDVYVVLKTSNTQYIPRLREIIEKTIMIKYKVLDLAYSTLEELKDPLNKGYPFKFLTSDQQDFRQNHKVIYGNGIMDILPVIIWDDVKHWRAKRIIENIDRFKDRPDLIRISAGQAILFMTREAGSEGIGKYDTLRVLETINDPEALMIWKAYVDGIEINYPHEYLAKFIKSRLIKYIL